MCSDWAENDAHNTAYIASLVEKLSEMHVTARTLGAIMYLALVANGQYTTEGTKAQKIGFRTNPIQHYHSLYFAHVLLTKADKDDTFKVPGLPQGKQPMSPRRV